MNAPALYDRFIVPDGQRKVSFVQETKVASAGTFTVLREDHTLGNLIRMCGRRACGAQPRRGPSAARARTRCPNLRLRSSFARRQLHSDDKVIFAGYQLPHPLVNELKIKARAPRTTTLRLPSLTGRATSCADSDAAG